MIVKKIDNNPFDRIGGSRAEVPKSTRILNTRSNVVKVVEPVRMTVTRTARRPTQQPEQVKTIEDFKVEQISIKWSTDYNIINLHSDIVDYLKKTKEEAKVVKKTIDAYKTHGASIKSPSDVAQLRIKIEELEIKLANLTSLSLMDYNIAASPIISQYKKLSVSEPRVFGQKAKINNLQLSQKSELVQKFFEVALNYYPLSVTRITSSENKCHNCEGNLVKHSEYYQCTECDSITNIYEIQEERTDYEEFTLKKSSSEDNSNYKDIVQQCAGIYPITIPDHVIISIKEVIDQYCDYDIAKMTKVDLLAIMKQLSMGLWYKHINKIHHMLTGIKPMDISCYISNLYKRGDLLHDIYDRIKPDDKSNFIHGLYLVWIFLKNEGCEPNMDDFCLLKSRNCEVENIDILSKGFEILRKTHPEFKWEIFQLP